MRVEKMLKSSKFSIHKGTEFIFNDEFRYIFSDLIDIHRKILLIGTLDTKKKAKYHLQLHFQIGLIEWDFSRQTGWNKAFMVLNQRWLWLTACKCNKNSPSLTLFLISAWMLLRPNKRDWICFLKVFAMKCWNIQYFTQ